MFKKFKGYIKMKKEQALLRSELYNILDDRIIELEATVLTLQEENVRNIRYITALQTRCSQLSTWCDQITKIKHYDIQNVEDL